MTLPIAQSARPAVDQTAPSSAAAAKSTAAKFEGLFVREMLKSMRAAKLDDGLLQTDADANWADMRDQLFADTLAARAPIGVASQLQGPKP